MLLLFTLHASLFTALLIYHQFFLPQLLNSFHAAMFPKVFLKILHIVDIVVDKFFECLLVALNGAPFLYVIYFLLIFALHVARI